MCVLSGKDFVMVLNHRYICEDGTNYGNRVEHIARDVAEHGLSMSYIAQLFGVSQRRAQQITKYYRERGEIQEVIVYHGTQFTANKRDKRGRARHRFEEYWDNMQIKLIFTRYNHLQSSVNRFESM